MKEKITAIVLAAGQGKRMHSKIQNSFWRFRIILYYIIL